MLCRVPPGSVDMILSYCHHALNDKSLQDLLPFLREKGVGVVNGSVLSMGLLTNKVCTFGRTS
jgi:L-galactose dehydrogenase